MDATDMAKGALDNVTVVCPECGKKPTHCTATQLSDGIVKEDITCCGGAGYVMVHPQTGHVVDARYTKTSQPGATSPAYIPLVFAGGASGGTRTLGWVRESLPRSGSCCASSKAACGFWGKVKQCLSKILH